MRSYHLGKAMIAWHALCLAVLLPAILCVSGVAATNAAPARTNAVSSMVAIPALPMASNRPVSVFEDETGKGKDPFFPVSQRRMKVVVPVAAEEKTTNSKLADSLYLEGMITGKNPLVIINNTVIQANKSLLQSVKIGDEALIIRFLEFKKKSVIIAVGAKGEKKEVRFRDGL